MPGEVVILRAYTFTNYAGRFLYVEAHNKATHEQRRPGDVVVLHRPDGVRTVSFGRQHQPDGGDAAIGGNKIPTDAAAQYMYHRGLVALRGDDANLRPTRIYGARRGRHRRLRHERRRSSGPARRCRRGSPSSRRTSSRSTWTRPRSTTGWTS